MAETSDPFSLTFWINPTVLSEVALVVVLAPELIRHRREQLERNFRIGLNLEVLDPRKNSKPIYGMGETVKDMGDIIDRIANPQAYNEVKAGNEVLIVGDAQSGKKALAQLLAKKAGISRVVMVHNPRDADVLARAKSILEGKESLWRKAAGHIVKRNPPKTMLLLPGLDHVEAHKQEPWLDQLEALIETASVVPNIFVVGTVQKYDSDGTVASWFGNVVSLPVGDEWKNNMRQIANGYLTAALGESRHLEKGLKHDDVLGNILKAAKNPAEIEDIIANVLTSTIYSERIHPDEGSVITRNMVEKAIRRTSPRQPKP